MYHDNYYQHIIDLQVAWPPANLEGILAAEDIVMIDSQSLRFSN